MGRKQEAPTLVVLDRSASERLTSADGRRIKEEAAQLRMERRQSSMRYLLRRQLAPWYVAAVVGALGAVTWLVRWLVDPLTAVMLAALVAGLVVWVAWMVAHRANLWRFRVHLAAAASSMWLLYASVTGPSWMAALFLLVATVAVAARWQQAHRIPHPKAPSREEPKVRDESIPVLWAENIADKAGVLPGTRLTGKDTSKPNCEMYVINLRPGKQTITQTLGLLDKIAGGLSTKVKQLVLEPHPDENPNHMLLTIVNVSPIDKTLTYAGARISGPRRNIIDIGPYGDGEGMAPWRMWAPGEQPMTGSWLSGFIVGGTGIGKSRLMELLAAGYMASGNAIVWFADPQGGASSPALKQYADWYVDAEGTPVMLAALERIAAAREMENSVYEWTRFDPSPERPGIVVFLDECQVTFGKYGKRWADLARKTQKVGISFVGLTQYAALESLGGQEPLRASLLANAIVMKANSNTNKHLIAGLELDPESLPKIPGFGYVIGADGETRTAPFRSEYLSDPQAWFEQYKMPVLDALSVNAAGDTYRLRRETSAELQEANRAKVEAMRGGRFQPTLDEPDLDEAPAQGGAFQAPVFPAGVKVITPPERSGRERVLSAVARGVTRTADIQEAVGLGKSQLFSTLKDLVESGELEQPTRGVYRIAGSGS